MSDEDTIRDLILRWADAVHTGDLETVLADHDPNIVMFDVPPPYDGIRGIDAYRQSWPPFFDWQRQGASFEIRSRCSTSASTNSPRLRGDRDFAEIRDLFAVSAQRH
jgi:ketosteroid isomerase-like protein